MRYKIQVYNIYEFGKRTDNEGNPHQEDSIFPDFNQANDADRLFLVCDGMGGHDSGEVASATVCQSMSDTILNTVHDPEGPFDIKVLDMAIANAYDALDGKDTGAMKKMGTTMTMLKLYDHGAVIAHIGDSRVYHIRPGKTADDTRILYRTWDHSLVCDFIRAGILTEEEAKHSPQKNVITKAMQPNSDRPAPTIKKTRDIKPGDYFYLCTDGMLEQMDIPELKEIFSAQGGDDLKKVKTLIKETADNQDNHTATIVHIVDVIDPVDDSVAPDEFDEQFSDTFDGLNLNTESTATDPTAGVSINTDPNPLTAQQPCLSSGESGIRRLSKGFIITFIILTISIILAAIWLYFAYTTSPSANNKQPIHNERIIMPGSDVYRDKADERIRKREEEAIREESQKAHEKQKTELIENESQTR